MRTMVVWCPDWSVVAALAEHAESGAEVPTSAPAAVLANNVVEVCNGAARSEGVRRGQRRRDAQSRCPDLLLLPANPDRDARLFEPVLSTVEELRPGVAPIRPGLLAVAAPGRFYARAGSDGEETSAAVLAETLVAAGVWDVRIGIADDVFTAEQAARQALPQSSVIVPRGGTAVFLAPLPVNVLALDPDGREMADLLRRLGLRTLGDFGKLGAREVSNRFGAYGMAVWRRAQGTAAEHLPVRTPPPETACEIAFEPPLESAEAITFSVRTTAERFITGLADRQLAATGVRIEAETDGVVVSARTWLHPRCFTSRDLVDRVHWQMQASIPTSGLRSLKSSGTISAPIDRIRFLPDTVEPAGDHADGLWGGGAAEEVLRGVARIQAMVGYDAVRVPVLQGGRSAADRQALVPWGERPTGLRPLDRPWPGRIPGPAPARVFAQPVPAEVVDEAGVVVEVTERGVVTREPWSFRFVGRGASEASVTRPSLPWQPVASWAGPWPVDEGWWVPDGAGLSARFQVVGVDGLAWLMRWRPGGWEVEAGYD